MDHTMKLAYSLLLSSALIGTVGCVSTSQVTQLAPVGPALTDVSHKQGVGTLEVYTARQQVAPTDLALETWEWNSDFGKNEFLRAPAHTSYTLYTAEGKFLRKVRNANNTNDANPTAVDLPPGEYRIQAEAEDAGGGAFAVAMSVVVEPGLKTIVHLDGAWQPPHGVDAKSTVKLPNGNYVGWRAATPPEPHLQASATSTSN